MKTRSEDRLKPELQRSGFTLIELMVAAALSLVIMTIMALAFQSAMSTLSNLKSMGDQADRLRTAEVMLRADLEADHIVGDDAGSTIKVSDLRFDQGTQTVKGGYFFVSTAAGTFEGIDSDSIPSFRSTGATNELSMTVKRTSRTPSDLFGSPVAIGRVSDTLSDNGISKWAEVKWQLFPRTPINGVNMFSLHRVVKPIQDPALINPAPVPYITTTSTNPTIAGTGDDIVLTNVVSFEVKPLLFNNAGNLVGGSDSPYSDTPFNTSFAANSTVATSQAAQQKIRCVAVLVKVRLYDIKTKLTRQMSLIVKI